MLKIIRWCLNVFNELLRGFFGLRDMGPCVTVFGSARIMEGSRTYDQVYDLGRELARLGYVVMTGGGPGLMQAANKGAFEGGGLSIGCSISLIKHEPTNNYLNRKFIFKHFFIRKIMLSKYSVAFVAAPGGFGTLDELFEVITLVQTHKIKPCPIYLLNSKYWKPIIDFIHSEMIQNGTISQMDTQLIQYSDDPISLAQNIHRYHHGNSIHSKGQSVIHPPSETMRRFGS